MEVGGGAGVRSTAEVGLGWAVLVGDEGMDVRVDAAGGEVRSVALWESDGVTASDGRLQAKFISSRIVSKGREDRRCLQGMILLLIDKNIFSDHDPKKSFYIAFRLLFSAVVKSSLAVFLKAA